MEEMQVHVMNININGDCFVDTYSYKSSTFVACLQGAYIFQSNGNCPGNVVCIMKDGVPLTERVIDFCKRLVKNKIDASKNGIENNDAKEVFVCDEETPDICTNI